MSIRKQKMEQSLALVQLYLHSGKTQEALRLLERVRPLFVQENMESNWALTYAQALITHGDPEKALETAQNEKDSYVAQHIRTMALHEMAKRSGDWRPFTEYLEACFAETQDGGLLFELCQLKAHVQEWSYIADHASMLMQLVGTADAVRLAAGAAWYAERPQQCAQLLDAHIHLFPGEVLPIDLRRLQVQCQARLGALSQAVTEAEELVRHDDTTENILTLINVQMQKGDLKGLALTARRLTSRDDVSSRNLLRITRLILFDDPELAKQFWHAVLRRAEVLQDPDLLGEALSLGFKLGLDAETAPLFARMQEFATQGKGSFRPFSLKDLPAVAQNRAQWLDHVHQQYQRGTVPIHFVVEKLHIPLVRVFHSLLELNRKAPAPLSQPILWARHGGRPLHEQPIASAHWGLHLDVTALLLAADLDILDKVEQGFAPLKIATALPTALVRQRDMLMPHQPSRATGNRRLLQLFQDGRVQLIPEATEATAGPLDLVDKMGVAWVALLEKAKMDGSFLVDYLPLTSNNLEAEPIILPDQYHRHMINCRALVHSLWHHGYVSAPSYQQALHDLGSEGAVDVPSAMPDIGARIFLMGNIASVLADANLLELVSRHFQVFVDTRCLDQARQGLQEDEHREELAAWLERLIDHVREGLDRGVYEGISLPDDTSHAELEREEAENPDFLSLTALLHFPPQAGDVIWVDDRWVNGHAHRDGVPIIGVNDVLRALLQRGSLQESEYYSALLKLRAANVRYIPLEVGEILYHLQQAQVTKEAVVETPELVLLRRYIAACLLDETCLQRPPMPEGAPNSDGETAFVLGTMRVVGEAMVACWSDETGAGDRAELYADWILENLYTGLFGLQHLRSDPDPTSDGLDLIGLDIGNELARGFYLHGDLRATEENSSPRRKFFSWLESQVITRRFKADPSAVVAVASSLKKVLEELATCSYDDLDQDMVSRLLLQKYFLDLPESIGKTLQLDPDVLARLGVATFESINVGSLGFERTEFVEAVTKTLHGQAGRVHARTTDTEYVLSATGDERTGQVIEIKDHSNITVATFDDPIMELLRHDPSARQAWLKSHRFWFDCGSDAFERAVAEIVSVERPLERVEKVRAWRETSVAMFYARLEQQLRQTGQLRRDDLLPPSAGGFLRHFRLERCVDDADFHDRLHTAASALLAEEGLRSTMNRLGCLPIKLPAVCAEACDRLTNSERHQFFATLMRYWASPVCQLHVIDLALRYARDDPFCLNVARSTFAALCDETNGASHYRLFAAVLQCINDEFGYWAETASWPVSVKLAMMWAHTSRLHNIFMTVPTRPDQLAQWFEGVQHAVMSAEIFGREPAVWDDVLHPMRVSRTAFLVHGVATILAGHDPAIIEQIGVREVLFNISFPEANGNRSPHADLLYDPGLARNVLGSFFGGDRAAVLTPWLGSAPVEILASSSLKDMVKQAIQHLKTDPHQQEEWAKIGLIVRDLPMHEELRTEFSTLVGTVDFPSLTTADSRTASLALHVVASQMIYLADEDLRARSQAGLRAIAQLQAHRDISSTNDEADERNASTMRAFLFEDVLALSIQPGDLRGTSETFAKLMQEMFTIWPRLAYMLRPILSRLVKELPARQLHGMWRLVLQSRAYEG